MTWHPAAADLTTYMHGQMDVAYEQRHRAKCSREDFFDGYMAALRDLSSRSSFRPGHFDPEQVSHGGEAVEDVGSDDGPTGG